MPVADLQCVHILADMSKAQRSAFAEYGEVSEFAPGREIITQGKAADALYVLVDGKVGVYVTDPAGGEVHLRTIESGGHFGEMALLQASPRTASVRALAPSTVFRLDSDSFKRLLQNTELAAPFLHGLSRSLAIRLADITKRLADAQSLKEFWGP